MSVFAIPHKKMVKTILTAPNMPLKYSGSIITSDSEKKLSQLKVIVATKAKRKNKDSLEEYTRKERV